MRQIVGRCISGQPNITHRLVELQSEILNSKSVALPLLGEAQGVGPT